MNQPVTRRWRDLSIGRDVVMGEAVISTLRAGDYEADVLLPALGNGSGFLWRVSLDGAAPFADGATRTLPDAKHRAEEAIEKHRSEVSMQADGTGTRRDLALAGRLLRFFQPWEVVGWGFPSETFWMRRSAQRHKERVTSTMEIYQAATFEVRRRRPAARRGRRGLRYADRVLAVLAPEFEKLTESKVKEEARIAVARHYFSGDTRHLAVNLDDRRSRWRIVNDPNEPGRVRLGFFSHEQSDVDLERLNRINEALDGIGGGQ